MRRLPGNVEGNLFVDDTCIDCDLCRQIAPRSFQSDPGGYSVVYQQPQDDAANRRAMMALLACPTGSINTKEKPDLRPFRDAYPEVVADEVYFCGYASRDSFGAASYLIVRPEGNVLIDSPRFTRALVDRVEALGGISMMFLTHRDDVADHEKFHQHFGCERILHRDEAARIRAERMIEGQEPVDLDSSLTAIPTPGHTRGHMVLKYRDRFLFTGDHLAWSARHEHLIAFRRHNWYSWSETVRSMERLSGHTFEWVLPGHGRRAFFPRNDMRKEMLRCVEWMKEVA